MQNLARLEAVEDVSEILELLRELGAPEHLVRHHELVVEAAAELLAGIPETHEIGRRLVLQGAAVHDAGKIRAPDEMHGPGSSHELLCKELIASKGHMTLARFCETHARWRDDGLEIEDLLVALSDKLWKGKRVAELEERVVKRLAEDGGSDFWSVFAWADPLFERIADRGPERLRRAAEV